MLINGKEIDFSKAVLTVGDWREMSKYGITASNVREALSDANQMAHFLAIAAKRANPEATEKDIDAMPFNAAAQAFTDVARANAAHEEAGVDRPT